MTKQIRYVLAFLAVCLLAACVDTTHVAPPTPTLSATPTMPPTIVPGSSDDEQEVADTVRQFGLAIAQDKEFVALLVLTPSAQRVVAASNLRAFLGNDLRPRWLSVRKVHLDEDIAIADCMVGYETEEQPIKLRLVRLEGQWRIDTRVD